MGNVTHINPTGAESAVEESQPHSIEAEQQLLGALLSNNDHLGAVANIVTASDFYETVHAAIFDVIVAKVERDEVASPVTLKAALSAHEGLRELPPGYLARLAGAAVATYAIRDYAGLVADLSAKRQALAFLKEAGEALIAGAEATGDVMGRLEDAVVSMRPSDSRLRPVSFLSAATGAIEQIAEAYQGDGGPAIISPFNALYRIMPYSRAGDMVVLAGRPSMGKSAVALSYATAAARHGHPVVIASLEMTPEDMAMRVLSEATSEAGRAVAYSAMSAGDLDERGFRDTLDAAKTLEALPVSFLPSDFRTPGQITAGVKSALRQMGLENGKTPLIVLDYMQLMDGKGRDLREQMTDVSKKVKHLARSTGSVCMSLSQLSRGVETRNDKRPMLSDLRETGQIEQDADAVIFCYRDEYYIERERPGDDNLDDMADWQERLERARGKLELIVAKQRRGPIGTAHVHFTPAFNRVWEY